MNLRQGDEKLEDVRKWFYPGTDSNAWFEQVSQLTKPDMQICEIGSGSGKGLQNQLYPKAAFTFGIDLDERVLHNRHLDEAAAGSAYNLPALAKGKMFDLIYSHFVAEHIDDAEKFIGAQLACLKPDGTILHSTVSKHYWSSLVNNFVPERLKNGLIAKLGSGRPPEDIFPAHYRLNTERDIRKLARKFRLSYSVVFLDQAPGYLRRSMALMLIYTAIHKPLQALFPALRPTFIFSFRRLPN
jgi:SAM-dependent methyltransferase